MVLSLSGSSKHALRAISAFFCGRMVDRTVAARKSLFLSLRNAWETLSISAPTVVDTLRGSLSRELCDARLERWATRVVANNEMIVSVHGRENVRPEHLGHGDRAYLVMSNHQSHYDIAVLFYVLGSSLRMIAKRELFDVPIFGSAMRSAGFIAIDRKNKARAAASLEDAKRALASGIPIWIAPEGTRSATGELLPFKKGGFVLALTAQAPILPVSIRGTRDALLAKGLRSRKGAEVTVTVHPPIDPATFSSLSDKNARDALCEEVRRAIASGL